MKSVGKWIMVAAFAALFASCGAKLEERKVKQYRLGLAGGDMSFKPIIKSLVLDFNAQAGFRAIEFVESVDQANSNVFIVEGLEERDGKVGWGQWFAETERTGVNMPGTTLEEETRYSLRAEFDADFFRKHGKSENGLLDIELRKLFAHEIGHGFQMDHHVDPSNVMYKDISGNKDFSDYWPRVRAFFTN